VPIALGSQIIRHGGLAPAIAPGGMPMNPRIELKRAKVLNIGDMIDNSCSSLIVPLLGKPALFALAAHPFLSYRNFPESSLPPQVMQLFESK
jgi:hypothetical protein